LIFKTKRTKKTQTTDYKLAQCGGHSRKIHALACSGVILKNNQFLCSQIFSSFEKSKAALAACSSGIYRPLLTPRRLELWVVRSNPARVEGGGF
jgi:hypothetical protein